ncbi:MAG TPA: SDR family oxidoreductase, partial [Candidatus Eisenbacteria bacterium]|nr:SDR family oxidoreductase [Candidatus Eisenbacteria bacterium]
PVVLGGSGLVGGSFMRALAARGIAARGTFHTRAEPGLDPLDLTGDTAGYLDRVKATLVILASALTHVDYCESHPEETHARNVTALEPIVAWCAKRGAPLVFFSTDYVFDGEAGPYAEDAAPRPLSVYGRSKLEGERLVSTLERHAILRITNVFDVGWDTKNFLHRCVVHLRDGTPLVVPEDQRATPTYAPWLAAQTLDLIDRGLLAATGVTRLLHVACDELVSRLEFARRVAALLEADASRIEGRPTAVLGQAAARPLQGGLRNDTLKRLLDVPSLPLDDALHDVLPRMRTLYAAR